MSPCLTEFTPFDSIPQRLPVPRDGELWASKFQRPALVIEEERWNVEKCKKGRKCDDRCCGNWHSQAEMRCPMFVQVNCKEHANGSCKNGLHVQWSEVTESFAVDLESPRDAKARLRNLESQTPDMRARYSRIIVYGFAVVRVALLKRFLDILPLLHELMLPDRVRDPNLLVFLADMLEDCAQTNPRLREVVFQDNREEKMW
mmetsp:Transcript_58370/g.155368  ORF Transcript_58370/g.155368 Transcript_58370/m.155368 type:complete len:202 (-) Transcript_58370:97-702(-)